MRPAKSLTDCRPMSRREIERLFFSLSNRGMMFSPKQWMVVERWLKLGIPLEVIEKGIRQTFAKGKTARVSIDLCDQEVGRLWQWDQRNRCGVSRKLKGRDSFEQDERFLLLESLTQLMDFVRNKSVSEARIAQTYRQILSGLVKIEAEIKSSQQVDPLHYETEVDRIFLTAWDEFKASLSEDHLKAVQKEVEKELSAYKKRMTQKVFLETVHAVLEERLQELNGFEKQKLFQIRL